MNGKINQIQFLSLFIIIIMSSFLGIGIFSVIKSSESSALLSLIMSGVFGLGLIYIFITIFNYEQDLNFFQKINKLFGNLLGKIINLFFILSTLIIGVVMMYNLTQFITSQFLQSTPIVVVGGAFILLIGYAGTKNIETLSRISLILTVINIFLFFFAFLNLLFQVDINNFLPISTNVKKPLMGGIYPLLLNILPCFLLLCIPKNKINNSYTLNKNIFKTYGFVIFLMCCVIFGVIGVLGIDLAKIYQYPEYMVLKRVNYFNFLDRIENLVNIQWIFGLFFCLTMIIYFIKTFDTKKRISNQKWFPILLITIIFVLSIVLFPNISVFNNYIYKLAIYHRVISFILIIIIGIKIKLN